MTLKSLFKKLVESPAPQYQVAFIPAERSQPSVATEPIEARKHYLRIWLAEMYLHNDRKWFKKWFPTLHSSVQMKVGGGVRELPYVVGPSNLPNLEAGNLGQVIQLNHSLTGLLPYNGGEVQLNTGLLAMVSKDYLSDAINVVTRFSDLLSSTALSAALEIARPISEGLEQLFGAAEGQLHLGLSQTWAGSTGQGGNTLRSGYLAVVKAEPGDFKAANLYVKDGHLAYGLSLDGAVPVQSYTYFLLRLERVVERDDWNQLNAINEPFQRAVDALEQGEDETAKTSLRQAVGAAVRSADLTVADRRRVVQGLKDEFAAIQVDFEGLGAVAADASRALSDVMAKAMTVNQAAALGEIDLETLFGT